VHCTPRRALQKTENEKFAGGLYTTTVEAFIPAVGRGIQVQCLNQSLSALALRFGSEYLVGDCRFCVLHRLAACLLPLRTLSLLPLHRFPSMSIVSTHRCSVLQGATSHCLGQNFAKMFDIQFEGESEEKKGALFPHSSASALLMLSLIVCDPRPSARVAELVGSHHSLSTWITT
jgi:prolyl-tRNA synthetase